MHTPVGVKCRTCTGVKAGAPTSGAHVSAGASRDAPVGTAADRDRRKVWPGLLVGAGVLVLALAGLARASHHSTPTAGEPVTGALGPTITERTSEFVGAGGLHLGGTLTLPVATAGTQTNIPAVLIIPGLGAVDRDGVVVGGTPDATRDAVAGSLTVSALGSTEPMFKDLSQALAKAGIASFRYDKRGTAASQMKPDQKLSFADEVTDAQAALTFLSQRQEVGSAAIALLGHDQGGLVAMRAAAGNPRVKALIAVSTPARPLSDVLAGDLTAARGATVGDEFRASVAALNATGKVPAAGSLSPLIQPLFPAGQEGYLMSILSIDPKAEAKAVTVPALVVRGGGDQSLTATDAADLAAAIGPTAEVMTGGASTDRNLALPGPGHVHSNTVTAPTSNQDAELTGRLSAWILAKLHA
ncbi:MAG TPA: alpha/beta fold hydrolase [Acidimicrobiales bacterium]|nr:alpha/beta fold hydrolase [Acidimicrobiales bacterium]